MPRGSLPKNEPPSVWFWPRGVRVGDCFEWSGPRSSRGYGLVCPRRSSGVSRSTTSVHRYAWELMNGPIPEGMYICHHCDNPPCFEPTHLFLGTPSDNRRDASRKGRLLTGADHPMNTHPEWAARGEKSGSRIHPESRPRGEQHYRAKLVEHQVLGIRLRSKVESIRCLALEYGVSKACIAAIVHRRSWKHLK